jgi:hypothetical protein
LFELIAKTVKNYKAPFPILLHLGRSQSGGVEACEEFADLARLHFGAGKKYFNVRCFHIFGWFLMLVESDRFQRRTVAVRVEIGSGRGRAFLNRKLCYVACVFHDNSSFRFPLRAVEHGQSARSWADQPATNRRSEEPNTTQGFFPNASNRGNILQFIKKNQGATWKNFYTFTST